MANHLPLDKKKLVFQLLCEGNGVRSISRIVGVSVNTTAKLQCDIYKKIKSFNESLIQDLWSPTIEADEMRTYVQKKGRFDLTSGTQWIYIGMDRESRLIIDFHLGNRNTEHARLFLHKISDRLSAGSEISTDCLQSYIAALEHTQENYIWGTRDKIELTRARVLSTNIPAPGRGITNRIESQNGLVRQHVSRLTRRTRCISKKVERLEEHLTLYFFYYNFVKKHKTLKSCPGVASGLVTRPIDIEDLFKVEDITEFAYA